MPDKKNDLLEKVTLNLFLGDKDTLAAFHSDLGWSVAAREVIHKYCTILRAEEEKSLTPERVEIEVPRL